MKHEGKVRIGVVAADPLRAVGLQTILEETAGVDTASFRLGEAVSEDEVAALLLDSSSMDDLAEVLGQLRRDSPGVRVIVIGESLDPVHIQAVIGCGAKGYLTGTASEGEFRMALDVVLDGSVWAPRKVLARLIEAGGVTRAPGYEAERIAELLTPRERDVLHWLMEGRTNRQIAESMGVDLVTVKAHLGRMLRKAGVKNRVELTLKAMGDRAAEVRSESRNGKR